MEKKRKREVKERMRKKERRESLIQREKTFAWENGVGAGNQRVNHAGRWTGIRRLKVESNIIFDLAVYGTGK